MQGLSAKWPVVALVVAAWVIDAIAWRGVFSDASDESGTWECLVIQLDSVLVAVLVAVSLRFICQLQCILYIYSMPSMLVHDCRNRSRTTDLSYDVSK